MKPELEILKSYRKASWTSYIGMIFSGTVASAGHGDIITVVGACIIAYISGIFAHIAYIYRPFIPLIKEQLKKEGT